MYDLLDELGIDPENLRWDDLALCKNGDREWFFDKYESDQTVAKNVDELCLHCPVIKQCLQQAIEDGATGVWGGLYLINGKISDSRNEHKTPEVRQRLKERISNDNETEER